MSTTTITTSPPIMLSTTSSSSVMGRHLGDFVADSKALPNFSVPFVERLVGLGGGTTKTPHLSTTPIISTPPSNELINVASVDLDQMLWKPSIESMRQSVLYEFVQFLAKEAPKLFPPNTHSRPAFLQLKMERDPHLFHHALHQWSISDDRFWGLVWQFLQIKSSQPFKHVIQTVKPTPENSKYAASFINDRFFVGARINYAENLLRLCHDSNYRNREALVFVGESNVPTSEFGTVTVPRQIITYGELWDRVAKLAHTLRIRLGVKKMDRVVSLLPNCIEAVVAMLATTSIGAIWSSVSPDLGKKIVCDRFRQIAPIVLFTSEYYTFNGKVHCTNETAQYLVHHIPSIKTIFSVKTVEFNPLPNSSTPTTLQSMIQDKSPHIRLLNYQTEIIERYANDPTPDIHFEQISVQHPIYILYTSGTTGAPKCITQGFGILVNHLKETHMHCDVTSKDTAFVYTNCGWMMWNWMVSMLYTGCKLVLYDGSPLYPNHLAMWELIEREGITFFGTSARYLSFMATNQVDLIKENPLDMSRLRLITSTGSPLAPSTAVYVYKSLTPNVHLSSMSGGTDLNGCFAIGSPFLSVYPGELQCAGLGMNVQVWTESGERVIGDNGELVCLNPFPSAPLFFWGDADHNRYFDSYFSTFDGIWAQGDLAEQTKRFGFYVKGRSDSTLNPGGVRIGTGDYYDVLQLVEEVQDSIVVGQRQEDGNERVILFVQLRSGHQFMLDEQLINKIHDTIRRHLSARHRPSVISQVTEVPVNVNGKKMEKLVKKLVNQDPVQQAEISSLKNPECLFNFKPMNWVTGTIRSRL